MEKNIARAISWLLHPLLIPTYTLAILLNTDIFVPPSVPLTWKLMLTGIILLTTFVIPLTLTWILLRLRMITSFYLETREERIYPILTVAVFYYLTFYLLKGVHLFTVFRYFMLGGTLLAILALVINFYRKISLHTIGMGSVTGLFLGLSLKFGINFNTEILAGILLSGITGYARLKSGSHKPAEIYSGFVLGILVLVLLMLVF